MNAGPTLSAKAKAIGATEQWESSRTDLWFFRAQPTAIVRHFFEIASQIGRTPSILGREFFRAKVSHHAIPSFEEQAVFVCDVGRALGRLDLEDGKIVALVGLFQFSLADVAAMFGRSNSRIAKRYSDAIDQLTEILLETGLLRDDRPDRHVHRFAIESDGRSGLPPKKPVSSVTMYHIVRQEGKGLSFATEMREA